MQILRCDTCNTYLGAAPSGMLEPKTVLLCNECNIQRLSDVYTPAGGGQHPQFRLV